MQTYQSTPDFYRDYIEHGWLKDQAAKVHKYIERWRGKNGKWYYRYKSKAQELGAKAKRTLNGIDPETPTKYGLTIGDNNGKANSHSGKVNLVYKNPKDRKARFDAGIAAGRRRAAKQILAAKKGAQNKRTRGKTGSNLTSRGYSDSKSSSNNKATEKKIARREHMDYLKSNSVRNTRYGWEENPNGRIIDKETGKRYTPYRKRRKINK